MKKILALTVCLSFMCLVGCGKPRYIDGTLYDTCGVFNQDECKNDNIQYTISVGNVVWSILLSETVIFPIYFIGFSIWNPVGLKKDYKKGQK